jgi:Ras-related protein Ral-A
VPFVLVGNKVDLAHLRKVNYAEAEQLARDWNCPYIETSAKTRQNVDEVYCTLMRLISKRKELLHLEEAKSKKSSCLIL